MHCEAKLVTPAKLSFKFSVSLHLFIKKIKTTEASSLTLRLVHVRYDAENFFGVEFSCARKVQKGNKKEQKGYTVLIYVTMHCNKNRYDQEPLIFVTPGSDDSVYSPLTSSFQVLLKKKISLFRFQ